MTALAAARRLSIIGVILATPVGALCCGQSGPTPPDGQHGPTPASIRVQSLALDIGERVPLDYTVLDSAGTVLHDYPVQFRVSGPALAGVSADGVVSGLSYGATTLALTAATVTQSVAVQVSPWPHQPSQFRFVTERDFSRLATTATDTDGLQGWDPHTEYQFQQYFTIVSAPDAPRSPPSVLQALYPAGTTGGSDLATPGSAQRSFTPARRIYVSVWVELSPNWHAHGSGTNKVLYVLIAGQPRFFLSAEGVSSSDLQPTGRLQGTPDDMLRNRARLAPNVQPSARVIPGTWQRWEFVLVANTPGARDGEFHLWMDGVEVARDTDVEYLAPGEMDGWAMLDVRPIWGGAGDRLTDAQWMRFDHIYISTGS
ncbi:MAG TPA: hypothetical protein VHB25_07865 [Gemmatimonadaceae bacterium]|nr:hypothetical protein [Gemmatimonadaceae bacterium]